VIVDNVKILRRHDEDEIAARLRWYATRHPEITAEVVAC
jgi:hypothetical protein